MLKPEEALADAREKCAGEVQHRTSFPKALDGDRCRDSRPEGPPVTPSPPPRALAAVPQKAWLAWPRGQSRGGRAGWTVSVPSARQGWGGPRERGKVRGVFSAVRSPPAAWGTGSTQAGARKHADACVPKRAAPKKLLGGGGRREGKKKKRGKKAKESPAVFCRVSSPSAVTQPPNSPSSCHSEAGGDYAEALSRIDSCGTRA